MSVHHGYYSPLLGFTHSARKPPPLFEQTRLMSEFEASGTFWLPSSSEKTLWGRLKYTPGNGTTVVLEGALGGMRYGENHTFTEIQGRLFNGAPISLRNVWGDVESFWSSEEYFRSNLHGTLLLLGATPEASAADQYSESYITFSHLNGWFGRPFELKYTGSEDEECALRFRPDANVIRCELEGTEFQFSIFCARSLPSGSDKDSLHFAFNYKLVVTPATCQSLDWHISVATLLREFFTFLIGGGIYTLELCFLTESKDQRQTVNIFPKINIPLLVRVDERYFYSSHEQLKTHLPGLLQAWLLKKDELIVVRHALKDLLTVDGISPEGVFTRVVQTMEHFHGLAAVEQARYASERTWNRFNLWLKEAFPAFWSDGQLTELEELDRHKSAILGHFKGANRPTFRTRIEHLFRSVPRGRLMSIVDNPPDLDEYLSTFFPRVGSTRNYLTHFNTEDQRKAFTGPDLERATLQCWAVLTFCLGRFLGLDADLAGRMALQARRTMFLVGTKSDL